MIRIWKWNDKYISQRILAGVNAVLMNYKTDKTYIRIGQWRGQRGIVLCGQLQTAFPSLFVVVENGKHGLNMWGYIRAKVVMEEGLLSVWVSQSIVNQGRSMNTATFSTRDLREEGCKFYAASYRANKELVIPRMFCHELCR